MASYLAQAAAGSLVTLGLARNPIRDAGAKALVEVRVLSPRIPLYLPARCPFALRARARACVCVCVWLCVRACVCVYVWLCVW